MTHDPAVTRQWIIWYAIVVNLAWAALCLWSAAPLSTIPLSVLAHVGGHVVAAAICAAAAGCAIAGSYRESYSGQAGLLWFLPQQVLLTVGAFLAVGFIVAGHYADGVVRSRAFIAGDQVPFIVAAVFHSGAVLERYTLWPALRRWWKRE